jgi:hypothetical protein
MKYADFALKAVIIIAVVALLMGHTNKPQPDPQVEQLRAEMEQLRDDMTTEMEDVKNVQGYIVWQAEWENQRWGKGEGY